MISSRNSPYSYYKDREVGKFFAGKNFSTSPAFQLLFPTTWPLDLNIIGEFDKILIEESWFDILRISYLMDFYRRNSTF